MPKKIRLDQLLVARGFFTSREQARRAILAGNVSVGTRTAAKPSEPLDEQTVVAVKPTRKYVGRGALKLEPALDHFDIELEGQNCAGHWRFNWRVYRLHATTWRRKGLRGGCRLRPTGLETPQRSSSDCFGENQRAIPHCASKFPSLSIFA